MKKIVTIIAGVFILIWIAGCGRDVEDMILEEETTQETNLVETIPGATEELSVVIEVEADEETQTENEVVPLTSSIDSLRVEGTQLVDSNGNAIQLRGVSTHGIAWFPQYVNQDFFTELHEEWNANVVRLAMYVAEYGGYCNGGNQEELKQLVKDGVKYATEADMYVIVDWHVLQDANPNANKEDAKKFLLNDPPKMVHRSTKLYPLPANQRALLL